jgi:methionyl-tRNA synthetase
VPLLDPDDSRQPVDYHLVAGLPTPNGPTHLGHLGGPFLRLDVLARFQRLCGNRAFLISGTDVYESYVELASARSGVPSSEIAGRYHAEIERDLASLDIPHDAFIDPLDPTWSARYRWWHHHLLERLRALGCVETRSEKVLYSRRSGRYMFGGFLSGRCPECGCPVVGGSCEQCGMWFTPSSIVEPRSTLDQPDLEWREVSNLFLRVPDADLHRLLSGPELLPEHQLVLRSYLAREGPYWPLTQQLDWGVQGPAEVTAPAVFATYGLGILAYAALCGQEYGLLSGTGVNALAPDSGVITVSAQGFDSIVPDAFAIAVLRMLAPELGAYGNLTLNRYLLLEGSKFSTSRRHAIWTREASQVLDSDVVRHYLARVSPDLSETDFRVDEFVALANRHLVSGLDRRAQAGWDRLNAVPAPGSRSWHDPEKPSGAWVDHLERLLQRQRAALDPGCMRLADVVRALDEWPDVGAGPDSAGGGGAADPAAAYWWLKGAAVLAASLMPRWALATWRRLGHDGDPRLSAFWQTPPPIGAPAPASGRRFEPLDVATVRQLTGGGQQ